MIIKETNIAGVYIIEPKIVSDNRGLFIKNFNENTYVTMGLECDFKESFYSVSKKDVIRGMHFQVPPHDHAKLVYVVHGKIMDVVLDIRRGSLTYGDYVSIELSEENKNSVYISRGFAHGFAVKSDYAIVIYLLTTMHTHECDIGIRWDSFGMAWDIERPIVSERDNKLPSFRNFISPFIYGEMT